MKTLLVSFRPNRKVFYVYLYTHYLAYIFSNLVPAFIKQKCVNVRNKLYELSNINLITYVAIIRSKDYTQITAK